MMKFSVAYAAGSSSFWQELELPAPVTAEQAIIESRLLATFTELDINKLKIGIFGKVCKKNQVLTEGARVEIYQPTRVQETDDDDDDDDDEDY